MGKQTFGVFTISLDFEMYWGVRDKRSVGQYHENLLGVRQVIPRILDLFLKSGIHATWATVGFLFFRNKYELFQHLPDSLPDYDNKNLSPYNYLNEVEVFDNLIHFAPDIIESVCDIPGQEIGTHTFSHYYCSESGQTKKAFIDDLSAAVYIATRQGLTLKSLVFPRNQCNVDYLSILNTYGILCFRGNESSWLYQASHNHVYYFIKRAMRLLDCYINLTGYNTYIFPQKNSLPLNFPSSRFLRPYSPKLALLDGLRLRRITRAMDDAAKNNRIFHLWWHPHNFGKYIDHNISMLNYIIEHFLRLNQRYAMQSMNMGELAQLLNNHDT